MNLFRIHFLLLILLMTGVSSAFSQGTESALRTGDAIIVKLSGVPAEEVAVVSNTYDIGDNGTINLPYIGSIRAAGLTPSAMQRSIEAAYKGAEIFTNPTIQVTPNREAGTQVIYLSGEVKAPGRIMMTPGMTVHDAMTSAGGPTDFAKLKAIKMTRNGQTRFLDLRRADNPDAAIPAQPGDRIHVP